MACTYKIVNVVNGIFYYGSSIDFKKRIERHSRDLSYRKHHCIFLQRAYDKYGVDNFIYEIDKVFCNITEAREYEQYFLDVFFTALYNTSKCSSGGDLISYHPCREEIVSKMKDSLKKRFSCMTVQERKDKYGLPGVKNGMFGKTHTEEVKKESKIRSTGNQYALGYKHTPGSKQRMSDLAKTRVGDKNPFYGKIHSAETRKLMSKPRKHFLPPNVKKILVDNTEYDSLASAGRILNLSPSLIHYRLNSIKYPHYKYITNQGAETSRKA